MKKLAVFDLDGTLVNSIYDLADCVNTALENAALPQNTLEEYYYFVGNGMEHLVRSALKAKGTDDEIYKTVRADFDREYAIHCNDKTCAYEGMSELLHKLTLKGIETAVLSNKADGFIANILNKNFPNHEFSAAWGQREGIERKPSGEGLAKLISELGYENSDCVYIGDSEVDVLTAQNADVELIGVLWGFRSEDVLIDSGAKKLVKTPDELYEAIISI